MDNGDGKKIDTNHPSTHAPCHQHPNHPNTELCKCIRHRHSSYLYLWPSQMPTLHLLVFMPNTNDPLLSIEITIFLIFLSVFLVAHRLARQLARALRNEWTRSGRDTIEYSSWWCDKFAGATNWFIWWWRAGSVNTGPTTWYIIIFS